MASIVQFENGGFNHGARAEAPSDGSSSLAPRAFHLSAGAGEAGTSLFELLSLARWALPIIRFTYPFAVRRAVLPDIRRSL